MQATTEGFFFFPLLFKEYFELVDFEKLLEREKEFYFTFNLFLGMIFSPNLAETVLSKRKI